MSNKKRAGVLGSVLAAFTLILAFALPAAADPVPPEVSEACKTATAQFAGLSLDPESTSEELTQSKVSVDLACSDSGGIKARVNVLDEICIKADALTKEKVAKAGIVIPCNLPVPPFKNCDEAAAAGRFDIPSTDPKYGIHLDSGEDGIGCESVIESENIEEAPKPEIIESDLPVTG